MLALCIATTTQAHALYEVKDNLYFMKDDNEFSEEEMDEEALYVHKICTQSAIQSTYFKCSCVAGAYRQGREKQGPYIPQSQLLNNIYTTKSKECANIETIAGDTYAYCTNFVKSFRYREKNNNQYCQCVANKTALAFKKDPRLSLNYIGDLRASAMTSCN